MYNQRYIMCLFRYSQVSPLAIMFTTSYYTLEGPRYLWSLVSMQTHRGVSVSICVRVIPLSLTVYTLVDLFGCHVYGNQLVTCRLTAVSHHKFTIMTVQKFTHCRDLSLLGKLFCARFTHVQVHTISRLLIMRFPSEF